MSVKILNSMAEALMKARAAKMASKPAKVAAPAESAEAPEGEPAPLDLKKKMGLKK